MWIYVRKPIKFTVIGLKINVNNYKDDLDGLWTTGLLTIAACNSVQEFVFEFVYTCYRHLNWYFLNTKNIHGRAD